LVEMDVGTLIDMDVTPAHHYTTLMRIEIVISSSHDIIMKLLRFPLQGLILRFF